MRLLLTTDTVGGVWSYTRELVGGLLAHPDVAITLVTLGRLPLPDQHRWLHETRVAHGGRFQCTVTEVPLEWQRDNALAYEGAESLLRQEVESYRPDVVHTNQFCFGALPVRVPKLVVAHSDVLSWHRAVHGRDPEDSAWLRQYVALVRAGLAGADAVVSPTMVALQELRTSFGPLRRGSAIPNGRDVRATRAHRKLQAVTAGRVWDIAKGMSVLEELYSAMPTLIAGETQSNDATYDAARLRRCVLLGHQAEGATLGLFAESAVYLATSIYEPFGLSPVEAALCGCAIVARDIPAFREVWSDAATYFNDAADLRKALQTFAGDAMLLASAQKAACARAKDHYSRKTMTEAYLRLYRDLLQPAHAPTAEAHPA